MRGSRTLVVAALAALVVACGGDGDDEGSEADEAAMEPAAEPTAETEEPDPEPTETPEPLVYEVQAGDTLSAIARDFDVTVEDLVEANDIEDPDLLFEGQELTIP